MTVVYDLINNGDHAVVQTRGEFSSAGNFFQFIEEVMHDIIPQRMHKVLIDNRALAGEPLSSFENYDIAAFLDGKPELRRVKMAVVVPTKRYKALMALETFIRNRGFSILGFSTVEEAREWLVGNRPSSPCQKQSLKKRPDCANYS